MKKALLLKLWKFFTKICNLFITDFLVIHEKKGYKFFIFLLNHFQQFFCWQYPGSVRKVNRHIIFDFPFRAFFLSFFPRYLIYSILYNNVCRWKKTFHFLWRTITTHVCVHYRKITIWLSIGCCDILYTANYRREASGDACGVEICGFEGNY